MSLPNSFLLLKLCIKKLTYSLHVCLELQLFHSPGRGTEIPNYSGSIHLASHFSKLRNTVHILWKNFAKILKNRTSCIQWCIQNPTFIYSMCTIRVLLQNKKIYNLPVGKKEEKKISHQFLGETGGFNGMIEELLTDIRAKWKYRWKPFDVVWICHMGTPPPTNQPHILK